MFIFMKNHLFYGQRTRQGQIVQEQQIRRTKTISPACHFIKIGQIKWSRPLQIIFKRQACFFFFSSSLHQSPSPPRRRPPRPIPAAVLKVDGTVKKCKFMADDDFLVVCEKVCVPWKLSTLRQAGLTWSDIWRHTHTHARELAGTDSRAGTPAV